MTDRVCTIETKEDLADFVEALHQDLVDNPDDWQNQTLEHYLASLSVWIADVMDVYFRNVGESPPDRPSWRTLGEMLLAAKYYE